MRENQPILCSKLLILKCCACFGPDSKQDYCAPRCQAINGGTVLKEKDNITVWFWIRSSLPKRVWKQCMEFNEKNREGKLEIWRVEDGVRRKVLIMLKHYPYSTLTAQTMISSLKG